MSSGSDNNVLIKNGRTYDILKDVVTLGIPGLGTLYGSIALIWGLPGSEQVLATAVALSTFGGIILKISSVQYKNSELGVDGTMVLNTTDLDAELLTTHGPDPRTLTDGQRVTFKVVDESNPNGFVAPNGSSQ